MSHRTTALSAAALLAIGACTDAPTSAPVRAADRPALSVTAGQEADTYLVRFKGSGVPAGFAAQVAQLGGEVIFAHAGVGIAAVGGLNGAAADQLAVRSDVAAVDADATTEIEVGAGEVESAEPSDAAPASPSNPALSAFITRQWNMTAVSAPAAWSAGKQGNASVRVGILDTGIDYLHPDLVGRVDLRASRSFLSAAENARVQAAFPGAHPVADLNYHGTHVAATVVSNGYLAAGVGSAATLVGLKVCTPGTAANGFRGSCPTSSTLNAILYAADAGLDVINMSLGGTFSRRAASARGGDGPSFLATINRVMNYANRKGTAVVVSAGNSAIDIDHDGNGYKAYCSAAAVICVSATGPTAGRLVARFTGDRIGHYVGVLDVDALAGYSNYGRSGISVAAPGGNALPVWAACSGFTIVVPSLAGCRTRLYTSPRSWRGSVVGLAGTSMAAPHVTGLAAIIAAEVGHNPAQITARLQQSADDLGQPGTDPAYGKGRINVARGAGL